MDTNRYKYEYRYYNPYGAKFKHSYELVGRLGALNLHISEHSGSLSAGLEFHHTKPIHGKDRPSHQHCWLLGAPCWHDGTSLYAEEYFIPHFDGKNHSILFKLLTQEANKRFYADGGDDD